jgi:hypothetical protein
MAAGAPVSRYTNQTAGTATSSSITVPAGDTILVAREVRGSSALPDAFALTDNRSGALSWTQLVNAAYRPATVGMRLQVWKALSDGGATTVTLTAGTTGANQGRTEIVSIPGAGSDFSNNNSAAPGTNAAGDPSFSLPSAPANDSTVLVWAAFNGANAPTARPSGFTLLEDVGAATTFLECMYDVGSPGQSGSFASTNTESIAFAVEIKAAPTPAGTATESDAALALAGKQLAPAGLTTAANSAFALAARQIRATGTATENEAALALGSARPAGLASEAEVAQQLGGVALLPVGLAIEVETALALVPGASPRADESEQAFALAAVQIRDAGAADDSETAFGLGAARPAGAADEAETAQALAARQIIAAGLASEIEAAAALPALAKKLAGSAAEADLALTLGSARPVGLAEELDEAEALEGIIPMLAPADRTARPDGGDRTADAATLGRTATAVSSGRSVIASSDNRIARPRRAA